MKRLLPLLLVMLAAFASVPTLSSCQVVKEGVETVEDGAADAWPTALGIGLGFAVGGPWGALIGGTIGSAWGSARRRLYSEREYSARLEAGEIYGRQQTIDLVAAARGAKIDAHPVAPPVPWYRSTWAILCYIVAGALTVRGANHLIRVVRGPDRLRALGHIYLGPLCPLPALPKLVA